VKTQESILIIDDEPQVRMNLRALLEDLGYQVHDAQGGGEGLAACAATNPDLILLDVRMPDMDGFEVCTRLKTVEASSAIPVIFLSGALDVQDKVKAFQAGAVDYVTKPFHFEEVEARVRTQLDIVHSRRRLEEHNRILQFALLERETLNRKLVEMNERLRSSEALKGHFLSTMRNEVNNPLNAILALGEDLEHGSIPPERHRTIGGMIASEASNLDFEIRNVFWAADLEAGEFYPHVTRVDVPSVLRAVQDSLRYLVRRKAIALTLEASGPGITEFGTDAEALRSIAANLLSNAIKFSPEGCPVQVRVRAGDSGLVLEVEDQGIGIRPEDQTLIFERFRQLESGSARLHQGQGLGLSVVRALVDLLEGSITLSSLPEKGSVFTCRLPRREPVDPAGTSSLDGNLFFFGKTEEL
jgi:signal transduction histidine kinase